MISPSENLVGRRYWCIDRETGERLYRFEVTQERVMYLDITVLEGPEKRAGTFAMVDRNAVLRGTNAYFRFEAC